VQLFASGGFLLSAMENKPSDFNESLWRRWLSDAERAALRAQPNLELEARLTESLAKIPDAPVASNFTARVLAAVELEETRRSRGWNFNWNWHAFFPRMAVTAAILVFAGITFQHYEINSQRTLLAKNVAQVTTTQPLPSVDALQNFDTIQRMSQPARADTELLALNLQ
jgi:negative regulator of sigma E activity